MMRIALLQQNFLVGDIAGNAAKIREGYRRALSRGADLVVSTELSLLGYPPRDLLERRDVIAAQRKALEALAREVSGIPLVVGFAESNREPRGAPLFNAAALLRDGQVAEVRRKALLPTYDVFDEHRYFESWSAPQEPIMVAGKRIAILICEDIWNGIEDPDGRRRYQEDPVEMLGEQGRVDALVVLNGSPYFWGKGDMRFSLVSAMARKLHAPVFYANQAGGNDELIFDGRSFAVNAKGECIGAAGAFQEDLLVVDSEIIAAKAMPTHGTRRFPMEAAWGWGPDISTSFRATPPAQGSHRHRARLFVERRARFSHGLRRCRGAELLQQGRRRRHEHHHQFGRGVPPYARGTSGPC